MTRPEHDQQTTLASLADLTAPALGELLEMLERSPDMITRHDAAGTYTYVSAACRAIYGREPGELVGHHPLEFVHPQDVPAVTDAIGRLRLGADWFRVEHRVVRPDDSCVWVQSDMHADRQRGVGVGSVRDVTAERTAVEALEEAQDNFRTIIELAADVLTRTTPDGRILYVSPGASRVLGRDPGELIGHNFREWAHPDDIPRCDDAYAGLRAGTDTVELEYRLAHPDGRYVWIHALLRSRRDRDGTLVEVVRAARDISEQKQQEERLHELSEIFEDALEHAPIGMGLQHPDGTYFKVNRELCRITGYPEDQLVGKSFRDLTPSDDLAADVAGHAGLAAGQQQTFEREKSYVHADGHTVDVAVSVSAVRHADGRLKLLVCQVRDITESRAQSVRLREITRRFEGAFEYAPIGMSLVDLDGHWMRVNRQLCKITGYSESELLSKSFRDITHPEDRDKTTGGWQDVFERDHWDSEKRYLHADGHTIWVAVSANIVRDERDEPQYVVTQTRDITERVRLERSLAHLADHDPLTELFNRRRFESELKQQVRLSRRYGDCAALLMLDLDHFKYVNDSLGHTVGDRVIAHVARLLASRLRDVDILARLGGDEFAVLLPRVDAQHAGVIATELVSGIERHPFTHDGHRYRLSCSSGVVMLDWSTASAEDALVSADIALYDAKQHGRNRVAVFSPGTRENVLEGLTWSQRLRDALSTDGFELHAQPIVDLSNGKTVMRELLIRMRSESGQIIPPSRFLEPAARFGYMPEIDRWVIAKAAQLAALRPGRQLAVNLAAQTIIEPELVRDVTDQLAQTGARPQDIVFELSEAAVIANLDQARETCEQLRALGCLIALDDFGSGFSGFPYLKALTIDLLKIDGQFIRDLASNHVDRLVVRAILDVACGLGLPTVAEFVIDEAVAEQCRILGATYGQGFHLGRPEPLIFPDAMAA